MADTVNPRLSSEVVLRGAGTDSFLVQHQRLRTQLPLPREREEVLLAMNGEHSLEELEALLPAGPGTLPYRDLALLLFQLWDRGLLENEDEVRDALFPHHRERTLDRAMQWRGVRNLLSSTLMGKPLSSLLSGRMLLAVQGLLTLVAIVAVFVGQVPWPDNLFQLQGDWVTGTVLAYLSMALMLTFRGLVRATILAAEGGGLQQVGLRQIVGIVYFDVDDREVYQLAPDLQVRFSLAGLFSTTSIAGFLVVSGLASVAPWATNVAAIGLALGFANLCPFFATDGSRLVEQLSGLSRQRFRVRSFISKELVRGLVNPVQGDNAGLQFSAVTTLWFLWFFGAVKLVVLLVVNHITVLQSMVLREGSTTLVAVVCGLLFAYILALVLVMIWVLVSVSLGLLRQVFVRRTTDVPDGTQGVSSLSDEERQRLVATIRQLTTAETIPEETLDDVLTGVEQNHFPKGAWLLRSGTALSSYYWVLAGRVELRRPLPEGGDVLVASLGPGESFGAGLDADQATDYDVQASEDCTILALDTGSLRAVADRGGENAAGLRALLDRLNFISHVPELSALGPSGRLELAGRAIDCKVAADELVVRQGDEPDALYLVRTGRVKVVREEAGELLQLAELGSGSTFGEMGLLFKRPRSATVTSTEASHLIKVPRDVFEDVLKRSFYVGLALEGLASARQESQE